MNILVTGSAGFIGYHAANALLNKGFNVTGIDNINDYYDIQIKKKRIEMLSSFANYRFEKIDISKFELLKEILEESSIDAVIHLAAQAGVRYSIENPFLYTQSNLVGFSNILEICRKMNVKKLVYASTSSVYGANTNMPFSEKAIADHPIQFYAATKRANELMAHSYSHLYNLNTIGLRFFTVYGPWGRPDMALFKFTKNIIENKPIQVFNNGEHIRDFTYIDDIVSGVNGALERIIPTTSSWDSNIPSPEFSSAPFEIYNLGNGKPVKLMKYIREIEKNLGKKAKIQFQPLQKGDVVKTESDISLAKQNLGYNPTTNIENGIKNFVNWYKSYFS